MTMPFLNKWRAFFFEKVNGTGLNGEEDEDGEGEERELPSQQPKPRN